MTGELRVALAAAGFALALVASGPSTLASADNVVLIEKGEVWRYLDDGSDQGGAWRGPGFDDDAWSSGSAPLGYGTSKESTLLRFGGDPLAKHITSYFRRAFEVQDVSAFRGLQLALKRDDGGVVYLNGVEVLASNLPPGVDYRTPALSDISGDGELVFVAAPIDPALLVTGRNVVCVEIHQQSGRSPDMGFDLELVGLSSPSDPVVLWGPYLQRGSTHGIVVRWATDRPTIGLVRFGSSPDALDHSADGPIAVAHEIELTDLEAGTRYYYAVGTPRAVIAGGDAETFFQTPPVTGTAAPARFWVVGDSGLANSVARGVRDDYARFSGDRPTDAWLMLGDNAYQSGTLLQYVSAVFETYPKLLRNTVLWPTFGNHDARSASSALQTGVYFGIFTLPTSGESGGLPSGTEAYYSFDFANVHFVVLDSQGRSRDPAGPMLTWAAADLASTNQDWVIAYWHHPAYSKGSHDSDSLSDSQGRMVDMRRNALPLLEEAGVDLVLAGHSHVYERSRLIDGHYGSSTSFLSSHVLDGGDGCICSGACPECPAGGSGPYVKQSVGAAPHEGTVYSTVGSSSMATGGLPLNHPVMQVSLRRTGSLVIDVDGLRLDGHWIQSGGEVVDAFTLLKGGDADGDRIPDPEDNCSASVNPDQGDFDADGEGDACDPDVDGDAVVNTADECPGTPLGTAVGSAGCSLDELLTLRCPLDAEEPPTQTARCIRSLALEAWTDGLIAKRGVRAFVRSHLPGRPRGSSPRH